MLEYSKTVPNPNESQINLDIQRTFPEEKICMEQSFLEKLKNILVCYSIRNTSIGYCQGMNFIVCRLLLIMDNEEQAFWIFIQIIEKILPIIYYSDLAGIIIDTTIIDTFLSFYLSNFYKYLVENSFKLSLSNFIHKWMVSLFTQALSPEMAYTFLDFFFLDGEINLFKSSIFVMIMIEEYLTKNNDFEYMFNIFNEAPSHIHDPKTLIYFLYEKNFEINENDINNYREKIKIPVLAKLKEEIRESFYKQCENRRKSLKKKKIQCNPNWPTCLYDNYNHIVVEYVIMKENKSPFLINDYYYIKNERNNDGKYDHLEELRLSSKKDILIERHKHVCDDMKLVNASQNLIENLTNRNKKLEIDNLFEETKNNDNTKIYGHLEESKDFDNIIKEIKNDLMIKEKEIDVKEIKLIIEKNSEGEKYYNRDYSFYVPE